MMKSLPALGVLAALSAALAGCGGGASEQESSASAARSLAATDMNAANCVASDCDPQSASLAALAAVTPGTVYTLVNPNSGKALQPAAGKSGDGVHTEIDTVNGTAAQKWQVVGNADGSYSLINQNGGKYLDVSGAGKSDGTAVNIYAGNATVAQHWQLNVNADGTYTLINPNSGKALDIKSAGTANGSGVQIYASNNTVAQKWRLNPVGGTTPPATSGLSAPAKKEIAMELVSSAENSSLDWKAQYRYIQDINDGRGYTGGIIGFCSGTGDMVELITAYTAAKSVNLLSKYLPAMKKLNGSASHAGLDPTFVGDWQNAAKDAVFTQSQDVERDRVYFNPSVAQAKADGLRTLGQFIYYDAIVMHGPGNDGVSFGGIRAAALRKALPPSQGGDETVYLNAFLDARVAAMKTEEAHGDVSRVETAQRVFLRAGNLDLNLPLTWKVYGDSYTIQ